jgi:hypothetical protein
MTMSNYLRITYPARTFESLEFVEKTSPTYGVFRVGLDKRELTIAMIDVFPAPPPDQFAERDLRIIVELAHKAGWAGWSQRFKSPRTDAYKEAGAEARIAADIMRRIFGSHHTNNPAHDYFHTVREFIQGAVTLTYPSGPR